ncbi:EFR1 family ferrodoxin [Candidatus Contubernalis alkaliaceticus]|uniref:EFR1 family ferrodoxin n=1 Tax=Candidatus Contubernalis alkaliaceticus TaxID=338645 RepID=UPI001F4C2518|nr:EFR1 family ferrodoxin [Candidatus Contubernalis alkalaceticus]UNC91242.1 hypothetical protein HUE98_03545 [Candidatus Contubernalis alkalaceticus]
MANIAHETENQLPVTKSIYYFSGTGNSYYVAKTIADSIGAVLKPIVSLKKGDVIEADILCFIFPVYDFKPPKKVTEIVENLSKISANYTIAIGTYGVALSSTLNYFKKSLNQKGVILSRGYGIKLPHNAVGSIGFTDEENYTRILRADKKICDIVGNIQARTVGDIEKTSIFENMTILKQFPHIIKLLFILLFKGPKSLEFTVTGDCISCYQCKKICPVNNIEWVNGKPDFGKDCTGCFACLQWCPKSAIRIGKYGFKGICMKHYHHPKVKAVDLIMDSSRE